MPQGVYVDGRNNVRVVEVGPIGPPGFGGSGGPSGPVELLPMTMSRLVPFVGWSQMGVPFNTMAWYGYRIGLAYASMPMISVSLESMLMAPIYIAKTDQTMNFRVSAFGVDFETNAFPNDTQFRVILSVGNLNSSDPPADRILGPIDLPTPNFTGPPGGDEDLETIVETNAMQFEFDLVSGEAILQIQMQALDSEGSPLSPELQNLAVAVMRVSMWIGNPSAKPHIDPYISNTYLGQQADQKLATMYNAGLFGATFMLANGSGLMGSGIRFTPEGIETEGLTASLMLEPDDEGSPTFVRWRANRLAVDAPPEGPTDVLRLMDAPDFTPTGLRRLVPSQNKFTIVDTDVIPPGAGTIYELVLTEPYASVEFSWQNVDPGFVATPLVIIRNHSGAPASVVIHGADGAAPNTTLGADEIWLAQCRVLNKDVPESPDLGVIDVDFEKIYFPTVQVPYPEIPKDFLSGAVPSGTNVPLNCDHLEMSDAADGTEAVFDNPGLGRYAIFEWAYQSGAAGEGYPVQNCNHYVGGTPEEPGTLVPATYYLWKVYVQGTESGLPTIDFLQEMP